jgi:muramidase (phage lysozyme)
MMNKLSNIKAYLDAVAWAEIGPRLLAQSDNGYNVCVGSTLAAPILFDSYDRHPMIRNKATNSDAAGRYQFMGRTIVTCSSCPTSARIRRTSGRST